MKILVTGGAGFIGHHLVERLVTRGDEVHVLDDFSSGLRSRLEGLSDRIELTCGSVLDPVSLDRAIAGCEVVLHEAAVASVARSFVDPAWVNAVNAGGTIEVIRAAARHGVRRVVMAGSSSVYGAGRLPCREDQAPDPQSPYAASKLAAEHLLHVLGGHLGVETVVLRYFNVFGPGQDPSSDYAAVVPSFVAAVLGHRRPVINGDGGITRDYLHVDNVVDANLAAARRSTPSGLTANVGSGGRRSLTELLRATCEAAGYDIEPVIGLARPGDIRDSEADIALARRTLGYRVTVPFDVGIARTVAWYRESARAPV